MSMASYSVHGFGLLLSMEEAEQFVNAFNKLHGTDHDVHSVIYDLPRAAVFDDEGGMCFAPVANVEKSLYGEDAAGLFIFAMRQPEPFRAAYSDINECCEEFKVHIGEYVPEEFNYEAHIGYYECAVYC